MKQSVLIASVLGGGVALGVACVGGYMALSHKDAPVQAVAAAPAMVAPGQMAANAVPGQMAANGVPGQMAPNGVPGQMMANAVPGQIAPNGAPGQMAANGVPGQNEYARVLSSSPITEGSTSTRTECHQERVVHQAPVTDTYRLTGTGIGGVLGGALCHEFVGKGRGKTAATVACTLAGGYGGNKVQEHMQQNDTTTEYVQRCSNVPTSHRRVVGYRIRYELNGQTHTIRADHAYRRGELLPVRDGQPLLS